MLPDAQFLLAHDRPGPRYTSYPTVPHWNAEASPGLLADAVDALDGGEPISVYVHVPFCREQCLYCGCNMVVSRLPAAGDRYVDALERQWDGLLGSRARWPMVRLHLGGGTPTWLAPDVLARLFAMIRARTSRPAGAGISIEADPEVTTDAHLDVMAAAGVTRLSLGVQSFDPEVLAAVHRPQGPAQVEALVQGARSRGIGSINLDLMYGLPAQTTGTLSRTLDEVLRLRPERLALFGYAHVPWMKPHQRKLDEGRLPDAPARAAMLLMAHERLRDAGYQPIGFDHFALPDDALAVAARAGTLNRDFMGYTARPRSALLGLGTSAISQFEDRFVQQEVGLGKWWKTVGTGQLPVAKGMHLSVDDRLRRDVILDLTCNHRADLDAWAARYGLDAGEVFADDLVRLRPSVEAGIASVDGHVVTVPELGRLLVRNVAMAFDAYLPGATARHSQVV